MQEFSDGNSQKLFKGHRLETWEPESEPYSLKYLKQLHDLRKNCKTQQHVHTFETHRVRK